MNINEKLVPPYLKELHYDITPPGCLDDYVESPIDSKKMSVQVGVVYEHRFAFYYWARFFQNYIVSNKFKFKSNPILITLDYHNDVGADRDCNPSDLKQLNLADRKELSMFCWTYLNPLNDGHILPALYLSFFSDVYVLNTEQIGKNRIYLDRNNDEHKINYFHDIGSLIQELDSVDFPVYLDIDLDYFTSYESREEITGASIMRSPEEIKKVLNFNQPLMARIFPKLVGLTIAIEPNHTGGFKQSMAIFDILNSELFDNSLLTDSCRWNYNINS